MEDVADINIGKSRENLSNWEDHIACLAPLTSEERDTIIELTSVAKCRPFLSCLGVKEAEKEGHVSKERTSSDSSFDGSLPDSLSQLQLGEIKIESSQQVCINFVFVSV